MQYVFSKVYLIAVLILYFCFTLEGSFGTPCQFSEWGEWTPCSRTCGIGRKARSRNCSCSNENVIYMDCKGELLEIENCTERLCRGLTNTDVYLEHVCIYT